MTLRFTRRRLLGSTLAATGAILTGLGFARGQTLTTKGKIMLDSYSPLSRGLVEAATFPLIEAIHGRRSRRFAKGASIPNGPLGLYLDRGATGARPDRADAADLDRCGQHRLGEPLRPPSRLRGQAAELHHGGGRAQLSVLGRVQHDRVLLHRRYRGLLPADPRHDAGAHRRQRRPEGLDRGAPRADRQAGRRAAEHPGGDALHGGPQHLVRQRARIDPDLAGRGCGAACDPAAALPRAERHRHL